MAETFSSHGVTTTIGVAQPPLQGQFVQDLKVAPVDESNWRLEDMWGAGPRKPVSEYPMFDSERVVEELVDRNAHR